MILLGILLPALAISIALRRWFAPLPWGVIAAALVLAIVFLHGAVFPSRVPVPVDEVVRGDPYRGVFGAVTSRNPLTNDTVKQILPWMQVVREELRAGRVPLWNRYQFAGYPLLANGQSAPFAPIFLATLFVPLPGQIVAMAGLKVFLALIFGWLFLRDEDVSPIAALFGSAIFAFSVFQTVYLYYPMTTVTSLLPAALFAVRGCVREGSSRWIALLAIVTAAVACGGHPESAVHIAIGCGVLLLIERRNPLRAIVAALLGVAIAAPAWVPVVEQALRSIRATSLAMAPHGAMDRNIAWLFLNPDGFGNPSRGNWQWIYNYSIAAPTYLGLLPLALLAGARRGREVALVVASAVLFLMAMNWTIVAHALNALPPMRLIAMDRLRFVVVFFVAIVAARVVTRVSIRVAISSVIVFAAAIWLLHAKWNVTLGWTSIAGVAALALFWVVVAVRRDLAPAAALIAIVVELFVFNTGFNALTSRVYYRPALPILARLQELARGEPSRIVAHDWTFLPNAAAQYGLEDVRGSDPMALASYVRFLRSFAANDPSSDVLRVQNTDAPELAFLGVRFLLAEPSYTPSSNWRLRYEGPEGKIYETTGWRRRFFAPRGDAHIGAIVEESPARIRFDVDAPRETLIASSQVAAPGWRVDRGRIAFLHDTFIGIVVPPGRHTITLTYLPRSFVASCVVALLALGITWWACKKAGFARSS
ncbi:MAG TPA: hypothetical protein VJZ00_16325 [Thermoanaerobaculia bacterium]|nr:hypothetical protein [Thermoanaerobaculia bacterium]